jgi:hypothetical protein
VARGFPRTEVIAKNLLYEQTHSDRLVLNQEKEVPSHRCAETPERESETFVADHGTRGQRRALRLHKPGCRTGNLSGSLRLAKEESENGFSTNRLHRRNGQ